MPDRYRHALWDVMAPIQEVILEHPFLRGLTDGTLGDDAFAHYVIQDAHYLREYARALAELSARAPDEAAIQLFAEHAANAIAVERELHASLLDELGIDAQTAASAEVTPTTLAYTSYLLSVTRGGSFAEGLGAVLPCYWIYAETGRALVAEGSPNPRYQTWIDTYAGEEFARIVESVLAVVDATGAHLSAAEDARVRGHVLTTARYEWMFWDAAWRTEDWPGPLAGLTT